MDRQATLAKNPTVHRQADTPKYPIVDRQLAQAKNPIVHRLSIQANDQLEVKQEIQWIGKPIHAAYLDQLVDQPVGPSPSEAALPDQPTLGPLEIAPLLAHQPEVRQPVLCLPVPRQPVVHQPGRQVPPLLSLHLQPDLNMLTRSLSPQALRYVHLSIQIGQNLLN